MGPPSDLELLELQVAALYLHDDAGRLLSTNDPARSPAHRFFLGRTAQGNAWRYRHDVPADLVAALEAVASTEPVVGDFRARPASIVLYREILGAQAAVRETYAGPAFHFTRETFAIGDAEMIHEDNATLLHPHFSNIMPELAQSQPCFAVVRDGIAVSVCFSARRTDRVAEAGVETHRDHRMRGYAGEVVAAWAEAIRDEGLLPLYSTSWDNAASLSVAKRLALVMYAEDVHLT